MKTARSIRNSFVALKDTRTLATCAMLLAMQVLLGFVATINIGQALRISFGFMAIATVAHLFGPAPAMINAALCDLIMFALRPTGPYHPGFTLTAALGGLIYGLLFHNKTITVSRIVAAKLVEDILCSLALNTLWIHQLYGRGFLALLPARAIKNMLQLPVDVVLLMLLLASLRRALAALGRPLPQKVELARPRTRRRLGVLLTAVWLIAALWLNNTSLFVDTQGRPPKWLAHRGLSQTFDIQGVEWDTDTSKIIHPPEHDYLENTIPSMRRAFELGASCVELDVRRTADGMLAVFHDDRLDYRTEATGTVSDHTMDQLRMLDVGYGYTADGGQTFPFRGKGVGMMPEFREVLEAFPNQELLIHLKDGDEQTAELVWNAVIGLEPERLSGLAFYGDEAAMAYLRDQSGELRLMSLSSLKDGLIRYMLLGWTGFVPESLKHTQVHIPETYARFLWGWPAKFMQRMEAQDVDTHVVLVAGNGNWSEGFDDIEARSRIPGNYTGYAWTNHIERIGGQE